MSALPSLPTHATIHDAVAAVAARLRGAGVDEAALEADLLVAHALDTDRTHLYARLAEPFPQAALRVLAEMTQRRAQRVPLAYILGWREFYGLRFAVRPGVLVPRPETETLVDEALAFAQSQWGPAGRGAEIADVGSGSGALAVTLAVHLPEATVYAIDTSETAVAVTRENAERHRVVDRVRFLRGDLLAPLPGPVDVIVANLPYVPSADLDHPQPELLHEPREALDGGPDGLSLILRMLQQVPHALRSGGAKRAVLMECDERHAGRLAGHCEQAFPHSEVRIVKDGFGRDRVVALELP